MTYKVTYYKVGIFAGHGRWVTKDIEGESWADVRSKAKKLWGFRNIKPIEWRQ